MKPKEHNQTVPEGYFESLPGLIMARIRKEECARELKELSPLLYSLQGENVFTVPRGYFEGLAEQIMEKRSSARVVEMIPRRRNIFRYAAAAIITGIMAISGWWIIDHSAHEKTGLAVNPNAIEYQAPEQIALNEIPADAIIKYLETTGTDADNEMLANNINAQELPSQTDYLLNDKTLETYLNQIDNN